MFHNIDQNTLIHILSKRIKDQKFLDLIWKTLRTGYMEGKTSNNSIFGTPRSIISPILANVCLHEFDVWVENFIATNEQLNKDGSTRKRVNPEYTYYVKELRRIKARKKRVSSERFAELMKGKSSTSSVLHNDPGIIRVKYVRYADDWLVAIDGPRHLAEQFKMDAAEFFKEELKLELSEEKTAIRNARKEEANFLGTRITIGAEEDLVVRVKPPKGNTLVKRRVATSHLTWMRVPIEDVLKRIRDKGFIDGNNQPQKRLLGYVRRNGRSLTLSQRSCEDTGTTIHSWITLGEIAYLQFLLQFSCAKTLCRKRQCSMKKLFTKVGAKCRVPKKRDGEGNVLAYTELALQSRWQKNRMDFKGGKGPTDLIHLGINLRTRTKLEELCVFCGGADEVEMHHVKHIRKGKAKGFTQVLQTINRKQIPACGNCHRDIHRGKYDGISIKDLASPQVTSR